MSRIHLSHSSPKVSGGAPLAPLRREDALVRSKSQDSSFPKELLSKRIDDHSCAGKNPAQDLDNGHVVADSLSPIERYRKGVVGIHVHFGWRCIVASNGAIAGLQDYLENSFCAVFQALPGRVVKSKLLRATINGNVSSLTNRPFLYDDKQAVFIDVVQSCETMKVSSDDVIGNGIVSLLRLKELDSCDGFSADKFSELLESASGLRGLFREDGELSMAALFTDTERQLTSEMVQTGAHVADCIADDESPLYWWLRSGNSAMPFRLLFEDGRMRGLTRPYTGPENLIKMVEVVFSPINLVSHSG